MNTTHIKANIVPLAEIDDLHGVAQDLHSGFVDSQNADLQLDFPFLASDFGHSVDGTEYNLREMQSANRPGVRENFITFAGSHAVGLSTVERTEYLPEGYDPAWPTLWSYLHAPWRGKGIGTQVLKARMVAAEDRFGGQAWTVIRHDNYPSRSAIKRAGFKADGLIGDDNPQILYSYGIHVPFNGKFVFADSSVDEPLAARR